MNVVLIGTVAVFVIFMAIGLRRGLFKSAFKVVASVLSIFLAYLLAPIVSNILIYHTDIDDNIKAKFEAQIKTEIQKHAEDSVNEFLNNNFYGTDSGMNPNVIDPATKQEMIDNLMKQELTKNQQIEFINEIEAPKFIKDALIENNHDDARQTMGVDGFNDYISTYITRMIVNAIAFAITFFVLGIILTIVSSVLGATVQLPIINTIDSFGGLVLGTVEALILIWIVFLFLDAIQKTSIGATCYEQIMSNKFLSTLYDKNLLNVIINDITKII